MRLGFFNSRYYYVSISVFEAALRYCTSHLSLFVCLFTRLSRKAMTDCNSRVKSSRKLIIRLRVSRVTRNWQISF